MGIIGIIGIMGILGIIGNGIIGIIGILGLIGLIKRARGCELSDKKNIPTLHSGGIPSSWSLLHEIFGF